MASCRDTCRPRQIQTYMQNDTFMNACIRTDHIKHTHIHTNGRSYKQTKTNILQNIQTGRGQGNCVPKDVIRRLSTKPRLEKVGRPLISDNNTLRRQRKELADTLILSRPPCLHRATQPPNPLLRRSRYIVRVGLSQQICFQRNTCGRFTNHGGFRT